jgi:hypothetical protein
MPKRKSTPTGPMSMQPVQHGSIAPTQLRMEPTADVETQPSRPKKQSLRTEAVRIAKAGAEGLMRLQLRRAKMPGLASGVDFPIEVTKVGQSVQRQAMLVLFAIDVHFHQMPGQSLTRALWFGTICKRAVYAQCAIDG